MIRIDILPDDVLLQIFDFYMDATIWREHEWESLVHVCRRWRTLVFRSPRRLNLQLVCTAKTPVRDTLDVWPALPLLIRCDMKSTSGTGNIVAALGQNNHVREVRLWNIAGLKSEEVLAAMEVPFPELTDLEFISDSDHETIPVIRDSFLDGSAPRLRRVEFIGIPFLGLPNLFLSATHLVDLKLLNIPQSGYISPEEFVALLSVLSSLERLAFGFESPQSCPDRETRPLPPSKRSVIPALEWFCFDGVIEYLEGLVTNIDTPQLYEMQITFFNQIDFNTPRLAQFFDRTPDLRKTDAHVRFDEHFARIALQVSPEFYYFGIQVRCREPDWQLSSIEQVCNSLWHPLSTVENLYIEHHYSKQVWKDDSIENTLWLQLLLPFTAVKNLFLSKEFEPGIASALQEMTGVLPSLQNIFVEGLGPSGPFQEKIGLFVATRRLSDYPITISLWGDPQWR